LMFPATVQMDPVGSNVVMAPLGLRRKP